MRFLFFGHMELAKSCVFNQTVQLMLVSLLFVILVHKSKERNLTIQL